MEFNNQLVFNHLGRMVTTSRLVAQKFNKQHRHILRDIKGLDCSKDFTESNFGLSEYTDSTGRKLPECVITKDGFTFLVMGFTGKQAAKFKEEYINAFNRMEQQLLSAPTEDEIIQMALNTLSKRLESKSKELAEAKEIIKEQEPKIKYVEDVLSSDDLIPVTIIAKELGMSAVSLNSRLKELGVQFRIKGHWLLTAKYQNLGYTKTKTHAFTDRFNKVHTNIQTYWTEKGREFIHSIINNGR